MIDLEEPHTISFFIQGKPIPAPRPSVTRRRTYMPTSPASEAWKTAIMVGCFRHRPKAPLEGPLRVNLFFAFERPKTHFLRKKLRLTAPVWHTFRPDRDNLDKNLLDQLTKQGFWKDDAQVCAGLIEKRYCDENPGCSVIIEILTPP